MPSKLSIELPEPEYKGRLLERSPVHLPYPPPGDTWGDPAVSLPPVDFTQSPFDSVPRVPPYPLGGKELPEGHITLPERRFSGVAHMATSLYLPYAKDAWPKITTIVPIPGPRFNESRFEPPFTLAHYSSMLDDAMAQGAEFKRQDAKRQNALHAVRLKAGQHNPVNGELGRHALPTGERLSVLGAELGAHPRDWNIPEAGDSVLSAVSV